MRIIQKERGQSFDPVVVDAFVRASDKILNTYNIYSDLEPDVEFDNNELEYKLGNEILVIEEDPIAREIISSQLSERGFKTSFAAGGMDAIMTLRSSKLTYGCVLTDINMVDFYC